MPLFNRVGIPISLSGVLSANLLAYTLIAAFQTMSSNPNIKIKGGKFNRIKGNLTVIDHSQHETNIESHNMYDNKLTGSYNTNSKKFGEQFQFILIQNHLMSRLRCS
jgi:hypothetical protein